MCLFLVGALDIAHTLYMQSAVEGIVGEEEAERRLLAWWASR